MITIKKKRIKFLARILALASAVCVTVTSFVLPSFANERWVNPIPAGNADDAGVYALTPIHTAQIHYFVYKDVAFNVESANYINLNNNNNDTPSFPQSLNYGCYSRNVEIEHYESELIPTLYNVETVFDPTLIGVEEIGYVEIQAEEVFLFGDRTSYRINGNDNYKPIYEYFTYMVVAEDGVDPDFTLDPYVSYGCTYFYLSDDGSTVCTQKSNENIRMQRHKQSDGRYRYYLYENIINNAPGNLLYVYVDYLYSSSDSGSLNLRSKVGFGNTNCFDYGPVVEYNSIDFEELLSLSNDTEHLENQIETLESERDELYRSYNDLLSSYEFLQSEFDYLENENVDLRQKNEQSIIDIAGKNEEIFAKDTEIKELKKKNFELRNTTGAVEEYFNGMSSALWNGLNEISDIGYSYVDSEGVTQTITIGSLITITVIGVVAFFIIKLFRGG